MTLDEVDRFQAELAGRSSPASSAIGRYQINRETRGELQKAMGLSGTERFTPELQDRMGRERLKRAGWDDYLAGRITRDQLQTKLAGVWASVGQPNGRSRHNQPVGTTSAQIQAAIDQAQAEAEHLRDLGDDPWAPAWR
jgi:muramidase (phage lysozyme)